MFVKTTNKNIKDNRKNFNKRLEEKRKKIIYKTLSLYQVDDENKHVLAEELSEIVAKEHFTIRIIM